MAQGGKSLQSVTQVSLNSFHINFVSYTHVCYEAIISLTQPLLHTKQQTELTLKWNTYTDI